ncbi:putative disease resistance RPP13-like protein 1 [Phaseolus vulgaris]|uniref:putative disease resistance RPP13-like protein 1 n=1 Tax=Phaseolus vulgaris TaxID=3885 RepID=UPI0035C96266
MDEIKFDLRAWICVSDEFDVFKVSRAILEHVTTSTDDSRDIEMVHRRLKEKLTGKKFFLVLDDVWNENQSKWEEVRKPLVLGAQGSKILVTTRSKEVASTMWSEEYSLQQLQEDDCWKLFAKHAFRGDHTQPNQECREIGMNIVKKCKGLPLALKTMGSMLYSKLSVSEWQTVFQSEIWEFSKERCDIIPALALSYIHLPSHLKDLIELWMTENFAHCHQHSRTSEEVCQQYFNDLLSRSFFQQSKQSGENEELFAMHDLLNDLAKYVGGDIYFRCEVYQRKKIQKLTRHFSVELGYCQHFDGFGTLCNTKRLRTFMPKCLSLSCFWRWDFKMSIHELFSKFKFLRILSLSGSDLHELPESVVNLEYLRSLDLSYTAIKILTEKICSLSHLQILKLNYCEDLDELPSNLYLLTNLFRLEFIETKVRKMPPHLGKLKNLKVVMSSFIVGQSRELGIQKLGEINLDGSLSIWNLRNILNFVDALEADLKNKTHLVALTLEWGGIRTLLIQEKSRP